MSKNGHSRILQILQIERFYNVSLRLSHSFAKATTPTRLTGGCTATKRFLVVQNKKGLSPSRGNQDGFCNPLASGIRFGVAGWAANRFLWRFGRISAIHVQDYISHEFTSESRETQYKEEKRRQDKLNQIQRNLPNLREFATVALNFGDWFPSPRPSDTPYGCAVSIIQSHCRCGIWWSLGIRQVSRSRCESSNTGSQLYFQNIKTREEFLHHGTKAYATAYS